MTWSDDWETRYKEEAETGFKVHNENKLYLEVGIELYKLDIVENYSLNSGKTKPTRNDKLIETIAETF